jgi:hypothetical protein
LTLITCHGYDEREAAYRWRIAARAVLVSIETENGRVVLAQASGGAAPSDLRPPALPAGR